jgi:hypothetical protein
MVRLVKHLTPTRGVENNPSNYRNLSVKEGILLGPTLIGK